MTLEFTEAGRQLSESSGDGAELDLFLRSRMMSGKRSSVVQFVPPKRGDVPADTALPPADFTDFESQRVLTAAARAVAREMGRKAAREYFAEIIGTHKEL